MKIHTKTDIRVIAGYILVAISMLSLLAKLMLY